MSVHLIKLSVGAERISDLQHWQRLVLRGNRGTDLEGFFHHVTRMMPRRVDELLDGGSIYWVIARQIRCRQRIMAVDAVETPEGRKCRLVLDPELVRVHPVARGPFQGWRYLKPEDAPADLADGNADDTGLPLRDQLAELGLL